MRQVIIFTNGDLVYWLMKAQMISLKIYFGRCKSVLWINQLWLIFWPVCITAFRRVEGFKMYNEYILANLVYSRSDDVQIPCIVKPWTNVLKYHVRNLTKCIWLRNSGNTHQNNTRVSALTVRYERTYITVFLTGHNESRNNDKSTIFTYRPCIAKWNSR